jgi:uncharacterized membrane protein YkvA (DUF1232 family)
MAGPERVNLGCGGSVIRMGFRFKAVDAFKRELRVYRQVLRHPRTPLLAKLLLGAAVGYLLMPFDLIPDFIPVLGQLDDLIIVPALVMLALWVVPRDLVQEVRSKGANV